MGLSLWLLVAAVLALSPLLLSTDARILMRLGLYKIFVLLAELVGEVDVEVEGRIERRFEERNDSSISGVEVGGVEEEMVF
jgi:hypothetical protein